MTLNDLNNASKSISQSKSTLIFLICGIILGLIGLITFAIIARKKFLFYIKEFKYFEKPSFMSTSIEQRRKLFELDE